MSISRTNRIHHSWIMSQDPGNMILTRVLKKSASGISCLDQIIPRFYPNIPGEDEHILGRTSNLLKTNTEPKLCKAEISNTFISDRNEIKQQEHKPGARKSLMLFSQLCGLCMDPWFLKYSYFYLHILIREKIKASKNSHLLQPRAWLRNWVSHLLWLYSS